MKNSRCASCERITIPGSCLSCDYFREISELPEDGAIGKQVIPAVVDGGDEIVTLFANAKTLAELPKLPNQSVVITEEVPDGKIVVVPQKEFKEWLFEHAEQGD